MSRDAPMFARVVPPFAAHAAKDVASRTQLCAGHALFCSTRSKRCRVTHPSLHGSRPLLSHSCQMVTRVVPNFARIVLIPAWNPLNPCNPWLEVDSRVQDETPHAAIPSDIGTGGQVADGAEVRVVDIHSWRGEVWMIQNIHGIQPHFELRSEEHTSELQSRVDLVCRLLLEKKK